MIKFDLICKCGQTFESWFSSSEEYNSLLKRKLLNCIYCNSTSVKKSIMAPNLSSKSNKTSNTDKSEKSLINQIKVL